MTSQIDVIENPSENSFRQNYVEKGRPVVILNAGITLSQRAWDFDYLSYLAGECKVPVYDWGEDGPTIEDKFLITQMKLSEAIGHARNVDSASTQRFSVCQLPIEVLPPLAREYETPGFLQNADSLDRLPLLFSESRRRALFISFFRGIHWHNGREAVAQLLTGRKKFVLYHPRDSRFLYPRKLVDSPRAWFDETEAVFCSDLPLERGLDAIDPEQFPLFSKATPIEVELKAGECLYIPSHWWHFTTAIDPCVVMVEFWDAPFRRWGYPIAWRSLVMKPYRKYLYRRLLRRKILSRNKVASAA